MVPGLRRPRTVTTAAAGGPARRDGSNACPRLLSASLRGQRGARMEAATPESIGSGPARDVVATRPCIDAANALASQSGKTGKGLGTVFACCVFRVTSPNPTGDRCGRPTGALHLGGAHAVPRCRGCQRRVNTDPPRMLRIWPANGGFSCSLGVRLLTCPNTSAARLAKPESASQCTRAGPPARLWNTAGRSTWNLHREAVLSFASLDLNGPMDTEPGYGRSRLRRSAAAPGRGRRAKWGPVSATVFGGAGNGAGRVVSGRDFWQQGAPRRPRAVSDRIQAR